MGPHRAHDGVADGVETTPGGNDVRAFVGFFARKNATARVTLYVWMIRGSERGDRTTPVM